MSSQSAKNLLRALCLQSRGESSIQKDIVLSLVSLLVATFSPIITIDTNTANQRLDRFLRKYLRKYPDISLVMIFKAIWTGQIKVIKATSGKLQATSGKLQGTSGKPQATSHNSQLANSVLIPQKVDQSYSLKIDDQIVFHQSFLDLFDKKNPAGKKQYHESKKTVLSVSLDDFQSWIVSEDDERLVINKPAGISIHPGQRVMNDKSRSTSLKLQASSDKQLTTNDKGQTTTVSLYDLIKQYYSSRGFAGSMFQPNVAYRLDKNTSGLVIVAKTYQGLQHLNEQIRDRKVSKEYYAIVVGRFPLQLTCNKPMKKVIDERFNRGKMMICSPDDLLGQEALTIGYTQKSRTDPVLGTLSLVRVELFTGRMHQIRVHLADMGYPILGDIVYGIPSHNRKLQHKYGFLRQLLHCHRYSFDDTHGKKISFEAEMVDDMAKVMQ